MPTIINGRGRVGVRTTVGPVAPAPSLLLDTYGGAAAAYSLRKLSSTYTGSAIRVRRSSDNTETNIGFDVNGNLDESALTSFVGANNGFVTTWYDQSGNGRNVTQTTANSQPRLVLNGVVETDNSKPSVNFDSYPPMRYTPGITFSSAATVARVTTQTLINYLIGSAGSGIFYNGFYGGIDGLGGFDGGNIRSLNGEDLNRHLGVFNMISNKLWISKDNNTSIDSGNFASYLTLGGSVGDGLGGRDVGSDGLYFKGKIQEVILWSSEQSSNESGIKSNINSFYSIY